MNAQVVHAKLWIGKNKVTKQKDLTTIIKLNECYTRHVDKI